MLSDIEWPPGVGRSQELLKRDYWLSLSRYPRTNGFAREFHRTFESMDTSEPRTERVFERSKRAMLSRLLRSKTRSVRGSEWSSAGSRRTDAVG